ncbi:PREDICTED: uncharacterized protein LOC104811154 [Tarenaya hassleriana]|uniref:uncharacterized protein LOC104811154 n=1 Tax=Tarenaya hassleriana TaxID=28532 RepID=UPI00053C8D36|nr:PREDICTED: uncharacterized protein LOC104811154 [Tarenaya hassleriana]
MDLRLWSYGVLCLFCLFIGSISAEIAIRQVTDQDLTERATRLGVTSFFRDEPPSSRLITIESFSIVKSRGEGYESALFEAAGYKWRLFMYPVGKQDDGGSNYVSMYLKIEETDSFPQNWEVNVDLKLFLLNQKLNKYLTVQDGTTKRFNAAKKQWGFAQMIPLSTFNNPNEGYVSGDRVTFGAEILILKKVQELEKVTFVSNPADNKFSWTILHFSQLEDKFYYSDDFLVGNRYWRIGFNPKGDGGGRGTALPVYLFAYGFAPNVPTTTTWGAVYLRLKNQRNSNHKQIYSAAWYPVWTGYGVGVNTIISFQELFDQSKGYLVNDRIVFEAEMTMVSVTNIVPN